MYPAYIYDFALVSFFFRERERGSIPHLFMLVVSKRKEKKRKNSKNLEILTIRAIRPTDRAIVGLVKPYEASRSNTLSWARAETSHVAITSQNREKSPSRRAARGGRNLTSS